MRGRDRCSAFLDFGVDLELLPSPQPRNKSQASLIRADNDELFTGYRGTISDSEGWSQPDEGSWPLKVFETSQGMVHVQLRPETNEPLLAEEQEEIAQNLFERAKRFSDIEADVCDILMGNWLKHARNDVNYRARIETDDLCRMRGLKPHLSGNGRRGGYTPNQRLVHLNACRSILESWIITREAPTYGRGGKRVSGSRVLESRPFVVTDRVGDNRFSWIDASCHNNCIDVLAFKYVVGEVFGAYLIANRQTALLSERALTYNAQRQFWEKRLTRYYSYLWRCRASEGNFSAPIKISTIFAEGLRVEINPRRFAAQQDHFVTSHRILERDGVIELPPFWLRNKGPWPEWTVTIQPPPEIRQHYAQISRPEHPQSPAQPPVEKGFDLLGQIRQKRLSVGLSQRQLADQLGIPRMNLHRAEHGKGPIPQPLREWLLHQDS